MADASEIAKALTAAWIRTEGTNKSAAETAEFSVPFITNLSVKPNKPGAQEVSPCLDRYDAASLLVLAAAALILLPVLLTYSVPAFCY
jgi:hypothetical protein